LTVTKEKKQFCNTNAFNVIKLLSIVTVTG